MELAINFGPVGPRCKDHYPEPVTPGAASGNWADRAKAGKSVRLAFCHAPSLSSIVKMTGVAARRAWIHASWWRALRPPGPLALQSSFFREARWTERAARCKA